MIPHGIRGDYMNRKYVLVMIALCGLAGASLGICFNTSGLFYTAVAADLGVGRAAVAMTNTICLLVGSAAQMITAKILREETLRPIILTAVVSLVVPTVLMSQVHAVWHLYVLNFIRGIGYGMTGMVLVTFVINHWFIAKLGMMTSIAMAFSGVPGVLFSPLITQVINSFGWRIGYVFVAGLILLFDLPALFIRFTISPETMGMKAYGAETQSRPQQELIKGAPQEFNYCSPAFILLTLFCVSAAVAAAIPQHMPAFAESTGSSAHVGSMMLSFSMAANILSKIIYGVLVDRRGTQFSILITAVICALASLSLIVFHSPTALLAGAFFFTVTYCNSGVGNAMMIRETFGTDGYAKAYPAIIFVSNIMNALAASFYGLLYDLTGTYVLMFVVSLILQGIMIAITVYMYRKIIPHKE